MTDKERIAELEADNARLRKALEVIPADLMLLGGPPYKVVFTEAAVRQITAALSSIGEHEHPDTARAEKDLYTKLHSREGKYQFDIYEPSGWPGSIDSHHGAHAYVGTGSEYLGRIAGLRFDDVNVTKKEMAQKIETSTGQLRGILEMVPVLHVISKCCGCGCGNPLGKIYKGHKMFCLSCGKYQENYYESLPRPGIHPCGEGGLND